jgi:mannose-6-phosphate isomerase-like protein (cupin superfamily)
MNIKTYSVTELGNLNNITRVTLKEKLDLTGAEISVNTLPAGAEIPFAHSHKRNEEIYIFTSGKGIFWLDETKHPVKEGTAIRVSPSCERSIKADSTSALTYLCIQVDEGSLVQATRDDGIISEKKPNWE